MSNFSYARCYENERWYFLGWSNTLLPTDRYPWSDETGRIKLERDTLACPPNTKWISEWEVDVDPDRTDNEGWMYITSFDDAKNGESDYANKNFRAANCRRRVWRRAFRNVTQKERDAILESYEGAKNNTPGQNQMNDLFGKEKKEDSWQMVGSHNNNKNLEQQVQEAAVGIAVTAAGAHVQNEVNNYHQQQQQVQWGNNNNNNNANQSTAKNNYPPPLPTEANNNNNTHNSSGDVKKGHEKKTSRGFAGLGASLSSTAGSIMDAFGFSSNNKDKKSENTPSATTTPTTETERSSSKNQHQDPNHHQQEQKQQQQQQEQKPLQHEEYKPDPLFASNKQQEGAVTLSSTKPNGSNEDLLFGKKHEEDPFATHTGNSHVVDRGDLSKPDPLFASASSSATPPKKTANDLAREEYHKNYFGASSSSNTSGASPEHRPDPLFSSSSATTNHHHGGSSMMGERENTKPYQPQDGSIFGSGNSDNNNNAAAASSSSQNKNNNDANLFSGASTTSAAHSSEQKAHDEVDDLLAKFM